MPGTVSAQMCTRCNALKTLMQMEVWSPGSSSPCEGFNHGATGRKKEKCHSLLGRAFPHISLPYSSDTQYWTSAFANPILRCWSPFPALWNRLWKGFPSREWVPAVSCTGNAAVTLLEPSSVLGSTSEHPAPPLLLDGWSPGVGQVHPKNCCVKLLQFNTVDKCNY